VSDNAALPPELISEIPGPRSRALAARLASVESQNVTCLVPEPPIFWQRAQGSNVWDVDGNRYIDYVCSWGPHILGHRHPDVMAAVEQALQRGTGFGAPTERETELAEMVVEIVPSVEKVRMVSSGTEATMSAIRLARGFTGRNLIIKFDGCYHGHSDSLLVKAGSGLLTLGIPNCPGVPEEIAQLTLNLPFNDVDALAQAFADYAGEIACVIIEPVAGNMGCIPPLPGFLEALREVTAHDGAVLIFDEVMTGFRVGLGGAQQRYGIVPDLTTLGKVIGGGMPVGAFGGKQEIMNHIAPLGPVYQAGTLSGNPVAMTAGLKNLEIISRPGFFEDLSAKTERLVSGLLEAAEANQIALRANRVGAMFGLFFTDQDQVSSFSDVSRCDVERFKLFFHGMLAQGVNLAPSAFEAGFISSAHSDAQIQQTIDAAAKVFATL